MKTSTIALMMVVAAGCTRPATGSSGMPWLDGAVKVTAQGTRPRSEVSLSRGGDLDPNSAAMEVMINDADVSLHTQNGRAIIDGVKLTLDDIDLPPSADLPNGLQMRAIWLDIAQPLRATIEQAEADTLVLSANTPLTVHSSMVLPDGTLYKLGNTDTEPGQLTIRVTTDGQKATATLDAAPPDTCWSIQGVGNSAGQQLLQANHCALFVESFAQVYSL